MILLLTFYFCTDFLTEGVKINKSEQEMKDYITKSSNDLLHLETLLRFLISTQAILNILGLEVSFFNLFTHGTLCLKR